MSSPVSFSAVSAETSPPGSSTQGQVALLRRLIGLLSVLSIAFLGAAMLPRNGEIAEAAIQMDLPLTIGPWTGTEREATEAEKEKLAKDTTFAKRLYDLAPQRSLFDGPVTLETPNQMSWLNKVDAGIVMSGNDLNQSIHRLERCLGAQGFKNLQTTPFTIRSKGKKFEIAKVTCHQEFPKNKERTEFVKVPSILYYFFVGHTALTASHYKRTMVDMRDRLIQGRDQRWGYVLFSSAVTEGIAGDAYYPKGRSAAETERDIQTIMQSVLDRTLIHEQLKP
jgi:Protein of unknown function (DUF3485)